MHITVAGKQVETGEALKTHVREGLNSIARKYFDHALEANVTFRRDRSFFACDINLKAGRGLLMRGEGEGADAHRAFEVAAEHVAKRLRRYRRRVNDHARSQAENRAEAETATQYILQPEEETEETASTPEEEAGTVNGHALDGTPDRSLIVAEQATEIARLSVGEAVMRLDLAQLTVLMFRNSGSGTLNVVYRRPDGCVGWIDTPAA
jgi:ribosomal subunit interface protein